MALKEKFSVFPFARTQSTLHEMSCGWLLGDRAMKKMTELLLRKLHQGYILEHMAGWRTRTTGHWTIMAATIDHDARIPHLIHIEEAPETATVPEEFGWKLLEKGWITPLDEWSSYVYGLTPKGLEKAEELFGPAATLILVREFSKHIIEVA
jgi:hypothetical protein